jgi:hypothetical protein
VVAVASVVCALVVRAGRRAGRTRTYDTTEPQGYPRP